MKIGFTGTRHGMSTAQHDRLRELLAKSGATELHHGDCVGADAEAHEIAGELGIVRKIHPPIDAKYAAGCPAPACDVAEPKTHFARNRDIVNETDELIATPLETTWQARGGTWYTADYGRKSGKPVTIIFPDGSEKRYG